MTGRLFAIEGVDGSGKQTQTELLHSRLVSEGYDVMQISYPRYEKESSALVKMYLRGDFGKDPADVSPYISSTFFAADRYASYKTEFEDFYKSGGIVLADRYVTSNMIHQAGKISDSDEREAFLSWLWNLEFELYAVPVPDKVFFLDIPPSHAFELMRRRGSENAQRKDGDIHENSSRHIAEAYENALELVHRYSWERITCTDSRGISDKQTIHNILYEALAEYL